MGVLTNERKRNHHHPYSPPCRIPSLTSSDSYSSKRSKLSSSSNLSKDSRFRPYSDRVVKMKNGMWNGMRERLGLAKTAAFGALRYFSIKDGVVVNKDDQVVEIQDDEVDEFEDDEVVEVVEIEDDEVVEVIEIKDDHQVVNVEGEPKGDSSIQKVVDGEFKALSLLPVERDVCVDNTMVVTTEKMFESLSLTEKKDLGLIEYKKKVCDVDRGYKMLDSPEKKQLALQLFESLSLTEKKDDMGLIEYKKKVRDVDREYKMLDSPESQIVIYEKKQQLALQLFRPPRIVGAGEKDTRKEMMDLAFKHLTKDEEDQVMSALSTYPRWKLLVKHESSNIDITVDRLQCLRPKQWLNDELISGKDGYDFQSVRRWTSQGKLGYCIFDCDKIFVPIHKEIHWCLAIINMKEQKFQYLDSLGHEDSRVLEILARYFADEVKDKSGKEIDISSWEQEFIADLPDGPEQENGFDCGMFMIKYVDFYSRDIGLCFGQEDMPYFRQRTAKEILNLKAE